MREVGENKVPVDLKVKKNKRKVFLLPLEHAGGRFNRQGFEKAILRPLTAVRMFA